MVLRDRMFSTMTPDEFRQPSHQSFRSLKPASRVARAINFIAFHYPPIQRLIRRHGPCHLLTAAVELANPVLMRSLGVVEPLKPTRPLSNYGVDSLVAVELRNWVPQQLEIDISVLQIVSVRTLTALCETLLGKLVR
ncbi:hypothetical protein KXV55_003844 [Aspergillus fumigatus]|nr:hypothetical protein KXV55_003844 [Aspergillus fumigatus]